MLFSSSKQIFMESSNLDTEDPNSSKIEISNIAFPKETAFVSTLIFET